jgi:hypothetical protein
LTLPVSLGDMIFLKIKYMSQNPFVKVVTSTDTRIMFLQERLDELFWAVGNIHMVLFEILFKVGEC